MNKPYNFGYWQVADRCYDNKLKAVTDAVPNGWWPHFNFFEDEFSQYNWTIEPEKTLDKLYCERAQYLRRSNNFIAIEFSGGADSWNTLYSFVRQGLKVDLILHKCTEPAIKGSESDKSVENSIAESYYQAYPWYKKFLELDPTLKWHTYHTDTDIIRGWESGPIDPLRFNHLHIGVMSKIPGFVHDGYSCVPNGGAILYGIDKPNILFENNKFYLYFPDHTVIGRGFAERERLGLSTKDIMFYYGPDCCELLAKQAHTVVKWFRQNPNMIWMLNSKNRPKGADDALSKGYRKLAISLLYPEYKEYWQSDKSAGFHHYEYDWWFHNSGDNSKHVQNWRSTMQNFSDLLHNTLTGTQFENFIKKENDFYILPASWSKLYYLGDL
jgi:hypothetical protein